MTDAEAPPPIDFDVKEQAMDEAPVGITISDPDQEDNPLVYVNEAFERVTGYPAEAVLGRNCRFLQGEDTEPAPVATLRAAIDAGEPVTVELLNYRRDGESFWNEVTVAPLFDDGEITHFVGFQSDVTRRKEAEQALAEERAHLDNLLDRIDRLLDAVTEAIVLATSRDDLETAVCERLAAIDGYAAAWIGAVDPASSAVTPATWAGRADDSTTGDPVPADHPAAEAARSRTVQLLEGPGETVALGAEDVGAVAAVPLHYRDALYGILTVLAPDSDAFDDREVTVFTGLGRAIGAAMSVLESRRILTSDAVTEVELQLTDDSLFEVHLSAAIDGDLTYVGDVLRDDGPLVFYDVSAGDPETLAAAARGHDDIESATVRRSEGARSRLEVEPTADSLAGRLAEYGARVESLEAVDGVADLRISLPADADVRAVYQRIRDRHPGTTLRSTTRRERAPETKGEYIDRIEDRLTARQRTALQTAYVAGYFDRPRHVTGDELAETMGVGRSTFHQHLRAAERKLLAAFFDH